MNELPSPASLPSYALPLKARQLTKAEYEAIVTAVRTMCYSPLAVAAAFSLSRGLVARIYSDALKRPE